MDEFGLIARLLAGRAEASPPLPVDAGDDGAVLPADSRRAVQVIDTLIEGVHFPPDTPAEAIGHKSLAVNLSDLAAMGAEPAYALLSLVLPEADGQWLDGFARGFHALARQHGVRLIGGDTTRSKPLVISVMLTGYLPTGRAPITRQGAQPGDRILVSGTLGDAAAGLATWQGQLNTDAATAKTLRQALDWPQPQVALGQALAGIVRCGLDVSDGLLADLAHLRGQHLGARIQAGAIPTSTPLLAAIADQKRRAQLQLSGGDDYQLLVCCAPGKVDAAMQAAGQLGVALSDIGEITADAVVEVRLNGQTLPPGEIGYRHF